MPTAFDKKSNTDDRVIPWLCLPKNTMSALPTVLLTTYLYWNICTLLTIDPKPHCTPDTIYLPASQRTPPYPGGQAQTNLFTRSLHDPPFWHGLLTHSFISERQIQITVKTRFTDTGLIRTPHYYGQFSLSMAKESPYIFSKFNPLNTDTFYAPLNVRMTYIWALTYIWGLTVLRSRSVQKIKTQSR